MYEKFNEKAWLGRVSAGYYGSVHGWKRPLRESFEPIKYAHKIALETGDM
jgi:hypothetical protein